MNVTTSVNLRAMPLSLNNGSGSLYLHQWIITIFSHIIESYEQFNDPKLFCLIALDCTILASEAEKVTGKLTDVVNYKTRYTDKNGKPLTLSFGLGKSINVNTIISLPFENGSQYWMLTVNVQCSR